MIDFVFAVLMWASFAVLAVCLAVLAVWRYVEWRDRRRDR